MDFDLESIKSIPLNLNLDDKLVWHYDKTGKYSVKSGYNLFQKIKIDGIFARTSPMGRIWNNVWKLKIPSKIKLFCWKALKGSLPNNLNLQNRGVHLSSLCPICDFHIENTDHCLLTCNRAQEVWKLTFQNVFLEVDF